MILAVLHCTDMCFVYLHYLTSLSLFLSNTLTSVTLYSFLWHEWNDYERVNCGAITPDEDMHSVYV